MILHFKYILLFCCIVLLHGKKKGKRDLSDLKDDPILSSLFDSDVKETRKDRSTTFKDELLAAQKDKAKHEQLNRILFPNKLEQRRETDPLSELMNMNKQTGPPESYLWNLNSNENINNNGNTNERLSEVAKQLPSGQTNVNSMESLQSAAVNPALFQSNYVPLPAEGSSPQIVPEARRSYISMYPIFNQYLWQRNAYPDVRQFMTNNARSYIPITPYTINTRLKDIPQDIPQFTIVSKKDNIPQVTPGSMQSPEVLKSKQGNKTSMEYKKSLIPLPLNPSITNSAPSKTSYPVQLRVNSPNEKLRGIVPHVPEYGETVESIRRVQQALNYRKSLIPQQPSIAPNPSVSKSKKSAIPKKGAHNKKQQSSKKSKKPKSKGKTSGGKQETKEQRQFIPSPPVQQFAAQQQFVPYIANYQQQNPFSIQQSVLQPYIAPPNAAQVQNMDGLHTRPIITAEECADQYNTCTDFAKNNYCTNYPELMKIQCRRSCGHCVPLQSQAAISQPATQQQQQVAPAMIQTSMPVAQQTAPLAGQAVPVQNVTAPTVPAVEGGETKTLSNATSQTDDSDGSGEADVGSGSGSDNTNDQAIPSSLKRSKEVSSALEAESGSGSITDAESGNAESGSGMEETSRFKGTPVTENSKKMPELNGAKRSRIERPKIVAKIVPKADFGEFSLPTKKSVIPTNENNDDDSGSGSGSGTESGDESGAESGDSVAEKKSATPVTKATPIRAKPTKKKSIPKKPSLPGAYPKIDLRAIASALAHYEEAALELAGEYPKPGSVDLTEYTRSFIPHPVDKAQENVNKYKQNLQVAKILTDERAKKSAIPKYLKLSKDAYKKEEAEEKESTDADNLDSVRQRFIIPGVEPTLNDYYAETGKINPFQKKHKNSKKSKIESNVFVQDPYEYIRNMPSGASMEPIVDPKARSTIPSDHSYPLFLMKVSPGEKKYIDEPATRRGKIRKLNAEGLPVFEDEKKPVAVPNPAPAPQQYFAAPKVETVPFPMQPSNYFMHPQPPPLMQAAPQARPAQEAVAIQSPWETNIEQMTAPKPSALFANDEPVQPEKQPGTNFLRSKMLSAFFSMKNNDDSENEGSGAGGSGDGTRRGQIHEQFEGSGGGESGTKKTITLHNLLFNENGVVNKEISVASGKAANQRKSQQDPSANYLQSNLAALTPENGNPNFEAQSGLTSGRLGAQFTMNRMSKTQETNWVRPNAESELASAMPESSSTTLETSHGVQSAESSSLLSSMRMQSSNFIEDQRPALRNVVPRAPLIKKKLMQAVGSSKAIIPSHIFTEQQQMPDFQQQQQHQRLDVIQKPTLHTDTNVMKGKFNPNNFVNLVTEKLSAPQLALASLQEKSAKTLLTEFPRSPFSTLKSNIPYAENSAQKNMNRYGASFGQTWNDNLVAKKNFINDIKNKQDMYSWRQYAPFSHTPQFIHQQLYDRQNPMMTNVLNNEKKSLLSAKVGAAQYAISNTPITGVNTVTSPIANFVNKQENNGQYAGWNYLVSAPSNIHPLSYIQKTENPVRKNLIKQKPDLDCGDNWEGAQGDFGTFCYKEMTMKASFDDALAECRRLKGDLFSVLNAYENRYLEDNIHEKFWIGYRDKGMDGNWSWTDRSSSIFTSWGKEVGNSDNRRHDCVFLDEEEGKWKDESCLQKKPFLCKKKTDNCPKSWKNLKLNSARGCYKLYTQSKDWEEAESACRLEGAHLASLTSEDEQTMVFQVHSSKSYWIGYNDQDSEGDWMWSDRSTSSYENWDEKSPNNGGVSCAAMTNGGKWNDEPCSEKLRFVCKRKGPKPEKLDGLDNSGILLPIARLLKSDDTAPSHVYDELAKNGPKPVVPIYFWPLLKTTKAGMTGNRPMVVHGDVRNIPDGIALDGVRSNLDAGDFHGKCITDPDKCPKGFAVALQIFLDNSVSGYKKPHCIIDTSGGGDGFTISISNDKLNYKVTSGEEVWELKTDFVVGLWQDIVMTWHKGKGIFVYVNGAFKDSESVSKKGMDRSSDGTTRLTVGRENKEKGPYTCAKMVLASVAIFTKFLSIEDVPYVFTYGNTVVATYRWLMTGMKESLIPEAPPVEIKESATDVDGGIYIDGEKGWLEIDNIDSIVYNIGKAKHGFSISFKVKFDQRVRDYKEERYILDSGGHTGGLEGISVYIVNDNLYFQVISNTQEDVMIWKVRVPIYTVRWQRVVMTWRLDKGLWVYIDGVFRGFTKIPSMVPEQTKNVPKQFLIGRKITQTKNAGAQFAFGSLAIFSRYLTRHETENIFGGIDNPFPGIIREVWKNTPGESLSGLKANPDYPNNPSTIEIIENFDAPFNVESNYGSKLKGYFIAPETGNSTFYLSCSKQCQLYFSADEESKNKMEIISLTESTWHNQWNKYKNQSSKDIFLVAGKYYYLEAIHKGVDASDSLSVGVRMPTGRYQRPIIKENLQWRLPGNQHAGLIREVWYDVPGYSISDLTSNANFPNRPSSTEVLDKFDAPFNYADNYGSRISGYFHAPETGDYRFYLSTDSSGELWISSDESESNLVKVVTLNGWTDHNQWLKFSDQKSDKIFLAAGRYYFMRLYMKAEKLGDCASVAVEFPSGHFEGPIKKKHLSWKIVSVNDGPGPKEIIEPTPKPVGLFQLNDASVKDILLPGNNKLELGDVDLTTGPGGLKDDAFMFKGNKSSYIEIPNDGRLDTKKSTTLLASIFPMGNDGPIINYKKDGWGVHLWQFNRNQLFARFVTKDGLMSTQPLGAKVIEMNKWNQVGASYDHKSGVAQLWHDGKMVKSRNIGQVELLTNASIRLGAREGDDRYYSGKISCVIIFDKALKEEQIGELRHCPKSKSKQQSPIENDELTVFAQGSGMAPDMEEFDTVENRIGDDTEEELTARGEKNKATKCDPNPCKSNGICQDDDKKIDGFVCHCADDFTGKHCQVSKPAAENPVVKRTEIPKSYERKEQTAAYTKINSTDLKNGKNPDESKEDISLLYQKLGCYKDDPNYRDLKTKVNLKKTSQEECAKACALEDKSFSYFGLQNGTSCYCGKNYGKYGKLLDEECSLKCEGNNEESCGGEHANDVFFFGLGTNYTVKTFTGRKPGAGTDAKVYLEFIGERGSSDFRQLDSLIEKYEPGSVDQQTFLLPDLGKLKRMKILHDNTGTAPSWYLEKVQVTDEEGSSYEFPCNDWLSDTQSGGKLERELQARSIVTLPT